MDSSAWCRQQAPDTELLLKGNYSYRPGYNMLWSPIMTIAYSISPSLQASRLSLSSLRVLEPIPNHRIPPVSSASQIFGHSEHAHTPHTIPAKSHASFHTQPLKKVSCELLSNAPFSLLSSSPKIPPGRSTRGVNINNSLGKSTSRWALPKEIFSFCIRNATRIATLRERPSVQCTSTWSGYGIRWHR